LQADFGILPDDWRQTLRVRDRIDSELSIFGVDPVDAIVESSDSPFASWKSWLKAKRRFYGHGGDYYYYPKTEAEETKDGQPLELLLPPETLLFKAPYFLRAARIWSRIFEWCRRRSLQHPSTRVGDRILQSLQPGLCEYDWKGIPEKKRHALHASQALFAFTGGQDSSGLQDSYEEAFDGLIGGYQAYGYYSCSKLVCLSGTDPQRPEILKIFIGVCFLSNQQNLMRNLYVDGDTGHLHFLFQADESLPVINPSPSEDDVLTWLEHHSRRLVDGEIGIGVMGSHPNDPQGLTLFPRFPTEVPPVITEGIQTVSRSVVRGVEIVGSSIYVPQGRDRFGFIYSIRIRLLTPDDEGYQPPAQRRFQTCQLHTRNWSITDDSTGQTNSVAGRGVIGMYPILHEGWYMEGGEECRGIFQYQSCTGAMSNGSFSGFIVFVPGSINSPTGEPFRAEVHPFALNNRPEYMY
jgi:uncharacterized protein affecting Mg2+/Co2+ transport